jgi:hypothetical protein
LFSDLAAANKQFFVLTNQVATNAFSHLCARNKEMARKNLLNINTNPPEVLALFTSERIYRVAWKLNQLLEISLESEQPKENHPSENHEMLFFEKEQDDFFGYLVANKGNWGLFYATKPAADFFLVWKSPEYMGMAARWAQTLKQDAFFQASYLFPQGSIKSNNFSNLFI